jgi:hypothetical protein
MPGKYDSSFHCSEPADPLTSFFFLRYWVWCHLDTQSKTKNCLDHHFSGLFLFNFWKIIFILFVSSESGVLQFVFDCILYCVGFFQLLCFHYVNGHFWTPTTVLMNFNSWTSCLSLSLKSKCVDLAVILYNLNWLFPAVLF